MQRICENTQICYAVLRGKSNLYIWGNEIQKKKMLDAAKKSQEEMQVQILAYCVLNNEMHLLVLASQEETEEFIDKTKKCYLELIAEVYQIKKSVIFRKDIIKILNGAEAAERYSIKLHLLPVDYGIVMQAKDYWWCSYSDYMGRKWIGLADVDWLLCQYDQKRNRAVSIMRKKHLDYMQKRTCSNSGRKYTEKMIQ
ncbi:MAG: hypothetical protein Q4F83_02525 [Eubacteriales bacterium]|nr:hypothetical protein [Eubacteriales bacterium]